MRPVVVYDDDCGFCTWAAARALELGRFDAVGFADLTAAQRERLPDDYEECAHLLTETAVYSCGEAFEQIAARTGAVGWWLVAAARRTPGYERLRERGYHWVADRRSLWGTYRRRESLE